MNTIPKEILTETKGQSIYIIGKDIYGNCHGEWNICRGKNNFCLNYFHVGELTFSLKDYNKTWTELQ
jgi:hypothetical protein